MDGGSDSTDLSLTEDEVRMVRLYRCLNANERDNVLTDVLQTLMARYKVDPCFDGYADKGDSELSSGEVNEYDARLMSAWPGEWPERGDVHLDNLGDPSAVLEQWIPEPLYSVMGASEQDRALAQGLALEYVNSMKEEGCPLSSDYGCAEDETKKGIEQSFLHFIREWRERVLRTIERQAGQGSDTSA